MSILLSLTDTAAEADVAEFLDDKVLDADIEGGQVRFRIQDAGPGV